MRKYLYLIMESKTGYSRFRISIDFTPSVGMVINRTGFGYSKVDSVLVDNNGLHATLEGPVKPTDPENQIEYLLKNNWEKVPLT